MAAKDGNPRRNDPRELDQRVQADAPVSADADSQMDLENRGRTPGEAMGEGKALPSGAGPSPPNRGVSDASDPADEEDPKSIADDPDDAAEASRNILSEAGLEDADESPVNPESEGFWQEETQLSSSQSVRQ